MFFEESLYIKSVIKTRTIWVGHVASMGKMRNIYKILVNILGGRDHSEDLSADGRLTLEWIIKEIGWVWNGCACGS
jgi:hypothetical protein